MVASRFNFLTPLALLASLAITGCQPANVAHPLTANLAGNDADSQLEFWHTLAERRVASNDEAFHGLLLYLDNKDSATDYAGRVALLKSRGMLPAHFNAPADESITRGNLAVAIAAILRLKGGWALHAFPNSPRYALRELEFEGVYPPSSENQTFSGTEFVGVVGKLEDYQGEVATAGK